MGLRNQWLCGRSRWRCAMWKVTVLSALGQQPLATLSHRRRLCCRPLDTTSGHMPHTRRHHGPWDEDIVCCNITSLDPRMGDNFIVDPGTLTQGWVTTHCQPQDATIQGWVMAFNAGLRMGGDDLLLASLTTLRCRIQGWVTAFNVGLGVACCQETSDLISSMSGDTRFSIGFMPQ